jgi:ACS family hexuronate transporter-like MFS transporter
MQAHPLRFLALFLFMLSSSLSFLNRQVLAALQPTLKTEFGFTATEYGYLLGAFSLAYALSAPLAGWFIDRVGLRKGIVAAVGLWSLIGSATAFATSFAALLACRALLGFAVAGGIPGSGKAVALYLAPKERALGAAFGQTGISLGMVAAPVLAGAMATRYGWQSAFIIAGLLGFVWIPLWWLVSRLIPYSEPPAAVDEQGLAGDKRLWGLVAANVLSMTIYSLWMNWTTVFLVRTQGLTQEDANLRFAWIPPLFAALGGLTGGTISLRLSGMGGGIPAARRKTILAGAMALLITGATPFLPGTALATAGICWGFFWSVAVSVNVYALPIDYFGARRAATSIAMLTFAYGLMQTVTSPAIGWLVDHYGFAPVCAGLSVAPFGAWMILEWTSNER